MKKIINTTNAPSPVGPYNQSVAHNGILYMSGQIAINPATGELVLDNIEAETHQVMKNIKAVLTEAGLTFEDVLKCSIFVSDMGSMPASIPFMQNTSMKKQHQRVIWLK